MITINDPTVEDDPACAAAALLESRAEPGPDISWDQIKVEA